MEPALPPEDHEARVVDLRPRHAARKLLDAESEPDALNVREELASRVAAETEALSAVAVLRGQVEELRVRADARDARDAALAKLAGELAVTARTAREEVERHAAARAQAEAALALERKRVEEMEAALAAERDRAAKAEGALRAELETLRAPRRPRRGLRVAPNSRRSPPRATGSAQPRRRSPCRTASSSTSGARRSGCASTRRRQPGCAGWSRGCAVARLRRRMGALEYHLAQVNIGTPMGPVDSPIM